MYRFHVSVHARPATALAEKSLDFDGAAVVALTVEPRQLATPLNVTFEQTFARLESLPRMFIEMDGSFVWSSPQGEPGWQVDGVLYDRAGQLLYVELKGRCPAAGFDQLLAAFDWPQTPLIFQLMRQALFLDEASFRRFAARTFP